MEPMVELESRPHLNIIALEECDDEQEDVERNFEQLSVTSSDSSSTKSSDMPTMPPHAAFLYKLLGPDEAEEFLHPKPEKMTATATRGVGGLQGVSEVNRLPRRPDGLSREVTTLSEHSYTANQLWNLLREDTEADMKEIESQNYRQLRDAYDSLVRQCIVKREMPELLKDLKTQEWNAFQRLIQRSTLSKIEEQRRVQNLMYRMARSNLDKQDILLHNNHLVPDFVNRVGDHTVNNYIGASTLEQCEAHRSYLRPPSSKWGGLTFHEVPEQLEPRPESQSTRHIISRLGLSQHVNVDQLHTKPPLPEHLTRAYRFLRPEENRPSGNFREHVEQIYTTPNPVETMLKDSLMRQEKESQKQRQNERYSQATSKFLSDTVKSNKKATSRAAKQCTLPMLPSRCPPSVLSLTGLLQPAQTKSYLKPGHPFSSPSTLTTVTGNTRQHPLWRRIDSIYS